MPMETAPKKSEFRRAVTETRHRLDGGLGCMADLKQARPNKPVIVEGT